ncbi:MAG: killer suppression protein [Deltaproteobacteria bacterium]|nr:killer suppression protein [Deltaproteobacteria bacterium]
MDILFRTKKLHKQCNSQKTLIIAYGPTKARLIRRRLDEFKAANTLQDIATLPGPRCHELTGNRAGQLSVDLDHPYRLLFRPANDPVPKKADGGFDWNQTTVVEILGVEDTHE